MADVPPDLASEVGDGGEDPSCQRSRSIFANQSSIWFSHDEYVGVKWSWTLGCAAKNPRTADVLWVARLSTIT